jgi:hypothetical protein
LNQAENLVNLPADLTQSEITAELSDRKLSGDLFNSVHPPLTGKEGWVTAVVAKALCIATENQARENLEHSTGRHTNTQSSKSYWIVDQIVTYCFMKKEQYDTFST